MDTARKEKASVPDEYRYKNFHQNISQLNLADIKMVVYHNRVGFIPGVEYMSQYMGINKCDIPH